VRPRLLACAHSLFRRRLASAVDAVRSTRDAWLPLAVAASFLTSPAAATAQSRSPIFQVDGIALRGYDIVSYFDGKAEEGTEAFQTTHRGVTWRFASAAHRDQFVAHPERFMPEYGGYCSVGMAHGGAVSTDPQAFALYKGKLYMNSNKLAKATWSYARDWMISRADPNWVRWLSSNTSAAIAPEVRPPSPARTPRPVGDSTLAIAGLDATSYFENGGPLPGAPDITAVWQGKTWRFRSPIHRERFLAEPARFAPQFDGLSPLILAHGDRVPGDPRLFTIVKGKLYLDPAEAPQETFRRNPGKLIARADSVWRARSTSPRR
jgi:YHS domain-containing protein